MKHLAQQLKTERLKRGWDLATLSAKTGIRIGVLRELEAGEDSLIGSPLLVRSLLRTCSLALQVDLDEPPVHPDAGQAVAPAAEDKLLVELAKIRLQLKRWQAATLFLLAAILLNGLLTTMLIYKMGDAEAERTASSGQSFRRQTDSNSGPPVQEREATPADPAKKATSSAPEQRTANPPPVPQQAVDPAPEIAGTGMDQPKQAIPTPQSQPDQKPRQETQPASRAEDPTVDPAEPGHDDGLELFMRGADLKETRMLAARKQAGTAVDEPGPRLQEQTGPGPAQAASHTFAVEAIRECWIQVRIDGGRAWSELLHPGDRRSWEVMEMVRLTIGNAGGLRLQWDGQSFGIAGKPGTVLRLRLPDQLPKD